jgi:anti-sigma B factor antagonist
MTTLHRLEFEDRGTVVLARLGGEVDAANAATVQADLLRRSNGGVLVLDLRDTGYLDSAGIAMLEALRRVTDLRLVYDHLSIVGRALSIVGFDQVLAVFDSVDDAVAAAPA